VEAVSEEIAEVPSRFMLLGIRSCVKLDTRTSVVKTCDGELD